VTHSLRIVAVAGCLTIGALPAFAGQDKPAAPQAQEKAAASADRANPVQVQVVISRYRDDKRLASMPYMLSVPVNQGPATLQVGGQVPIPSSGGQGGVQYRNVGTSLSVTVKQAGEGRYEVFTNVSESAVAGADLAALNIRPTVAAPVL
jgi:hypothetical protein